MRGEIVEMSIFNRRSVMKHSLAAASVAAFAQVSVFRKSLAQGAVYDIVSFGPLADGVHPEGYFWPVWGGIAGIHGAGMAFGDIATSPEKLTPALFESDGTSTKLKSGEFGGSVNAVNADGIAVGIAFDSINGVGSDRGKLGQPAVWIDRELTRLPIPEPFQPGIDAAGVAEMITDDGVIFGRGSGFALRWINGEVEILPPDIFPDSYIIHERMLTDGTLVVRRQNYSTNELVFGYLVGSEIEPLSLPDGFMSDPNFQIVAESSDGALLTRVWGQGSPQTKIARRGEDPIDVTFETRDEYFLPGGLNSANQVVGSWQRTEADAVTAAVWEDGVMTSLESLLPANHEFHRIRATGISDEGIIAGEGWDEDGAFHPLLFVPS